MIMQLLFILGALVVFLVEIFNKSEIYDPTIGFYYRYSTSLWDKTSKITLEKETSLIYQFKQQEIPSSACNWVEYLINANWHELKHLENIKHGFLMVQYNYIDVAVITYENELTIYRYKHDPMMDPDYYTFNHKIPIKIAQQTQLPSIDQVQYFKEFETLLIISECVIAIRRQEIHKFTQFQMFGNYIIYQNDKHIMILSKYNKHYQMLQFAVKTNMKLNNRFPPILPHDDKFYVIRIPIQFEHQVTVIQVTLDRLGDRIILTIHYSQIAFQYGYSTNQVLLSEDVTQYYSHRYRKQLERFIKYASTNNLVYVLLGNQLQYLIRFVRNRYQVQKLLIQPSQNFDKNFNIIIIKVNQNYVILQTFNYKDDLNVFYYINLSQINPYFETLNVYLLELQDWKGHIERASIIDFEIRDHEVVFFLEKGDIVIGNLQLPIYMELFNIFMSMDGFDDLAQFRNSSAIWFTVILVLVIVKYYPG